MATGVAFAVQSVFRAASPFAARSPFGDTVFNEGILSDSEFYAPLTHSLALTRGTGSATYTRATAAWGFDNEGKLVTVPSGAARFGGARMVRNLLSFTEALTNAYWVKGAGVSIDPVKVAAPDGTLTAETVITGGALGSFRGASTPVLANEKMCSSVYLKYVSGSAWYRLMAFDGSGGQNRLWFNAQTGELGTCESVGGTSGAVAQVTTEANGYLRVSIAGTMPAGAVYWQISCQTANNSISGAVGSVSLWHPQLENVTGQADQSASEYVSVGVLSAPYHGAGIDGVKYFNTNKDGSAISAATLLGYHSEGARTNNLPYSRDLTNAAWVKTNVTADKTATGIDGAANSASTITAGAANATILQTLTLASAARSSSAYIKRRTGTGTISFTRNGGATWTDITSQINSSTWTRVKIENSSVLNPSIGFLLATSGDAIDVDVCQDEAGVFASSPIITTTVAVTRNADALSYASGNLNNSAGAILCTATTVNVDSAQHVGLVAVAGNGLFCRASGTADTTIRSYDGANIAQKTGLTALSTGMRKRAISWGGSTQSVTGDGAAVATGTFDGAWGTGTAPLIGQSPAYTEGHIKQAHIWQSALTDAQLQQVTA